jgi:hypothetical protein
MKRIGFAFVAVAFFTIATYAQGPPSPYSDRGACPFECCTYRDWTANKTTTLYRQMRDGSTRAFTVTKGEVVRGLTGVVITTRSGIATATADMMIGPRENIRVRKGDTLYLLTYQGEGFFKVWYKGRLVTDVEIDEQKMKVTRQPSSVWWVKVRNRKGQIGWSRLPDNFDNKDQCG